MVQNRVAKAAALILALSSMALGQLNQNCTISVLNRTVPVNPDGSWVLPNIPANFGQVKARATCVQNGATIFGESAFFTVPANGAVNLPSIVLGATTQIPVSLSIGPSTPSLTAAGQTVQLAVTAAYPDNSTKDVTPASAGTTYTTSNAAIASITPNGLVTAVSSGTVVIQATNDGATGITTVKVSVGGASVGGIPVSWAVANGLDINDPTMPFQDPDRDGLTNLQEFQLGTNPNNPDTDGDGLTDGDEVNKYHTNPLLADTDGDKIPDGVEVQTGTDPLNPNSFDLKKATATSTVTPPSFTLNTSIANPVLSVQLSWKVMLIDGRTTLDLTVDPRTTYSSSNLNICNFGVQAGLVFSGTPGSCVITISQSTLSMTVPGTVTGYTPTEISTLSVPGAVAVDVAGNFAYVAAGSNGLIVVDVNDRTKPRTRGTLGGIGNAQAVRASGQNVFIADANGVLRILQAQNPDVPTLVSSIAITGTPAALALHGTMVAVAAQSGGVSLVNIANPVNPSLIAQITTPAAALGVDFESQSGIAAIAMGTSGLQLADISNPSSPRLRGSLAGGDVRRVMLKLPAALLADAQRSVTAVNISNPDQPVLSTSLASNLGGIPVDIAAFGSIAMTADQSFGRAIPIIGIADPLNPSTLTFWTLLSPGFSSSIAVDISFGYVTIPATSTLRILKYQNIVDTFGIPPTISITSPVSGTTLIQGQPITITASAIDDVAVASVNLLVNGQTVATTFNSPYQFSYTVPLMATTLTFGATAVDYGNNMGTAANVTVQVIPDPLTTATGTVLTRTGAPVAGATVSAFGKSTTSAIDGTFSLAGLPTIQPPVVVTATVSLNGVLLAGFSSGVAPVLGGVTNVGSIQIVPRPVISKVKLKGVLAGTVVQNYVITGGNFVGATFSLLPPTNSPPMTIAVASVDPSGSSVTLTLNIAASASGQYAFLATNSAGTSDSNPSSSNSITILTDPTADSDSDGLSNGYEAQLGTDPLNPDTDGDGFPDGVEVASGSDPLNAACTPLNCRLSGEQESSTSSLINVNAALTGPLETDSKTISLINSNAALTGPLESDSIPLSICNGTSCAGYMPLQQVTSIEASRSVLGSLARGSRGVGGQSTDSTRTPFHVTSIAPANDSVEIALDATVDVAFSAPLDPGSIRADNFTLLDGDNSLPVTIRYSADFRIVRLQAALPADKLIQVQMGGDISDIFGRALPAFQSQYRTVHVPDREVPVLGQTPPAGAAGVVPPGVIRMFLASRMDRSVIMTVMQDGRPVTGSTEVRENGTIVEFTPDVPLAGDAAIQVALGASQDLSGRPWAAYTGIFTTATDEMPTPEITRITPGLRSAIPRNPVIEMEYSRPLEETSLTTGSIQLIETANSKSTLVRATVRSERTIRVVPNTVLKPFTVYELRVSGAVADALGNRALPVKQLVMTGFAEVTGPPALLGTVPAGDTGEIGTFGAIHLIFDRPLNPLTVGGGTIKVTQGDKPVAVSVEFAKDGAELILTPVIPLAAPGTVLISLTDVEDLAGNGMENWSAAFAVVTAPQRARRPGLPAAGRVEGPGAPAARK